MPPEDLPVYTCPPPPPPAFAAAAADAALAAHGLLPHCLRFAR